MQIDKKWFNCPPQKKISTLFNVRRQRDLFTPFLQDDTAAKKGSEPKNLMWSRGREKNRPSLLYLLGVLVVPALLVGPGESDSEFSRRPQKSRAAVWGGGSGFRFLSCRERPSPAQEDFVSKTGGGNEISENKCGTIGPLGPLGPTTCARRKEENKKKRRWERQLSLIFEASVALEGTLEHANPTTAPIQLSFSRCSGCLTHQRGVCVCVGWRDGVFFSITAGLVIVNLSGRNILRKL